jgi:hypothetical protein
MGYDAPIVALTAFAEESNVKECMDSGMDMFLAKPIRRPALKQVLKKFATIPEEPEPSLSRNNTEESVPKAKTVDQVRPEPMDRIASGDDENEKAAMDLAAGDKAGAAAQLGEKTEPSPFANANHHPAPHPSTRTDSGESKRSAAAAFRDEHLRRVSSEGVSPMTRPVDASGGEWDEKENRH